MDWQEAVEVYHILVATGRAVPPELWVEELIAERELASLESLI